MTGLDLEKLKECRQLCARIAETPTRCLILININSQRLFLNEGSISISYLISTALKGTGQELDSGKIPLGLHRVKEKIGEGADPFAIFKNRQCTEEIAVPEVGGAAIVGRILCLEGLEAGINRGNNLEGKSVDSFERGIFIHGTNDNENIGKAVSQGCIRMLPNDIVELFNKVPVGTLVYIYKT